MTAQQQEQQNKEERGIAVELNNAAVAMLEKGDCKGAVRELAKALTYYKHIMYRLQGGSMQNASSSSIIAPQHSYSPDASFFQYRQPIEIPKELETELSTMATILVSSIIIFNFALAYQFVALAMVAEHTQDTEKGSKFSFPENCDLSSVRHLMDNSDKLYELSFSMAGTQLELVCEAKQRSSYLRSFREQPAAE